MRKASGWHGLVLLMAGVVGGAGCTFRIEGVDLGPVPPDMAVPPGDMAVPPPDLRSPPPDLTVLPDLTPPPDLMPPPFPSHVPSDYLTRGTGDLTLMTANSINTGTVTPSTPPGIAGMNPLPGGVTFEVLGSFAVLTVQNLTVPSGQTVRVMGDRPLIVVASQTLTIDGTLDGAANFEVPGPGGSPPAMGSGAGEPAQLLGSHRGGAGAGYGAAGGGAGIAPGCGENTPRTGGMIYGDSQLLTFVGGSGGGFGGPATLCPTDGGIVPIFGGAGGGAIQLSANQSISIQGTINVGGGGGRGGCVVGSTDAVNGSGGGGGSGGALLVEAPAVTVSGTLAANGGSGGGGAGDTTRGDDGQNGLASTTAAVGGPGPGSRDGANGGNRGTPAGTTSSNAGGGSNPNCNSGGGGGAVGRIHIRTRSNAAQTGGSTISPDPTLATNL